MTFPQIPKSDLPHITTEQMIEVDRAAIEDYGLLLIQMMENAGRGLANLAREFTGDLRGKSVLVMAGAGGNGGGALVAARRVANYGAHVTVALGQDTAEMTKIPEHQRKLAVNMGLRGAHAPADPSVLDGKYDLILDGLIGYSLKGSPFGLIGELIAAANKNGAPIIALDAPSGVDTTTGTVYDPAIKAAATLTLALPKSGLFMDGVSAQTGRLYLGDLSIPTGLYARPPLDLDVGPIFAESDIIEII